MNECFTEFESLRALKPGKIVHKRTSITKEGTLEEITGHKQSWLQGTPPLTQQGNKLGSKSTRDSDREKNLKP